MRGYCRSQYDSCVNFRTLAGDERIYLLLYFDDMLVACKHKREIEKLKKELNPMFEIKDIGIATRIPGMQMVKDKHTKTLFLSQVEYVKMVLNRYAIVGSKLVSTPLVAHFRLCKLQEPVYDSNIEYMKKILYSSTVGSIMYVMVCLRPDLAYSIEVVIHEKSRQRALEWSKIGSKVSPRDCRVWNVVWQSE